jgi:signal transduction histidine kinase
MSADVRRQAFDPFFTTRRHQGCTGLGLHIVYSIVTDRLGGRLNANRRLSSLLELPEKGRQTLQPCHRFVGPRAARSLKALGLYAHRSEDPSFTTLPGIMPACRRAVYQS